MNNSDIIKQANVRDYRDSQLRKALTALGLAENADKEVAAFQPEDEREKYLEASGNMFKAIREQIGTWLG